MVISLLTTARHPEGHGARPHSLKLTTISALTTVVSKGNANFSQIATQGNYRDVTARDTKKIYSRKVALQQLFVSNFPQSVVLGNNGPNDLALGNPVFFETDGDLEVGICASQVRGNCIRVRGKAC